MDSEAVKKQKAEVGREAVDFIKDGMIVGIGSGSTMWYLVEALGKRVQAGLNIVGVPTSKYTREHAERLGIFFKASPNRSVIAIERC